jgi:hypothetical protein
VESCRSLEARSATPNLQKTTVQSHMAGFGLHTSSSERTLSRRLGGWQWTREGERVAWVNLRAENTRGKSGC